MSAQRLNLLLRLSKPGMEYYPGNLQSDLWQVESAYQDAGFLKVHLAPPEVQIQTIQGSKRAVIRILVEEGPLYRTGRVDVTNARAIELDTIRQLCPLQKGQPYSRVKIGQWQAKIEDAYRTMGYLRARCLPHETVDEAAKTVDCTLECAEGKVYTIGKITLTGNGPVNPVEFKRKLLFSEGGIFNPDMLATSLHFLNQARLYEPISNSDVGIKVDDERGTVDLSLRVVPLAH